MWVDRIARVVADVSIRPGSQYVHILLGLQERFHAAASLMKQQQSSIRSRACLHH